VKAPSTPSAFGPRRLTTLASERQGAAAFTGNKPNAIKQGAARAGSAISRLDNRKPLKTEGHLSRVNPPARSAAKVRPEKARKASPVLKRLDYSSHAGQHSSHLYSPNAKVNLQGEVVMTTGLHQERLHATSGGQPPFYTGTRRSSTPRRRDVSWRKYAWQHRQCRPARLSRTLPATATARPDSGSPCLPPRGLPPAVAEASGASRLFVVRVELPMDVSF